MPIYEYRCPNGHLFELFQRMDEAPVIEVHIIKSPEPPGGMGDLVVVLEERYQSGWLEYAGASQRAPSNRHQLLG